MALRYLQIVTLIASTCAVSLGVVTVAMHVPSHAFWAAVTAAVVATVALVLAHLDERHSDNQVAALQDLVQR